MDRPTFLLMNGNFTTINIDVVEVGKLIGGKVKKNIDMGVKDPEHGFTNACAIRMSYTLNYSGVLIPQNPYKTVSGKDKFWYIYRVNDLMKFLTTIFGEPDLIVKNPIPKDFLKKKGIIVLQ